MMWTEQVAAKLDEESVCPMVQVDAHNVVPVWVASPKVRTCVLGSARILQRSIS